MAPLPRKVDWSASARSSSEPAPSAPEPGPYGLPPEERDDLVPILERAYSGWMEVRIIKTMCPRDHRDTLHSTLGGYCSFKRGGSRLNPSNTSVCEEWQRWRVAEDETSGAWWSNSYRRLTCYEPGYYYDVEYGVFDPEEF